MPDPAEERHKPFTFPRRVIVRLATKGGKTYELCKRWHDPVDEETTFVVSFITEHAEEREAVETDDDENDAEEVTAQHYEVWAVSTQFLGLVYQLIMVTAAGGAPPEDFAQKFAEAMDKTPGTRVRTVLASEVEYAESEVRDMREAWPSIQEYFEGALGVSLEGGDQEQPKKPSAEAAVAAPANGG